MTAAPHYRAPSVAEAPDAADPDRTAEFPVIRLEDLEAAAVAAGIELVRHASVDTPGGSPADAVIGLAEREAAPPAPVAEANAPPPSAEQRGDDRERGLGDAGSMGGAHEPSQGRREEPESARTGRVAGPVAAERAPAEAQLRASTGGSDLGIAGNLTGTAEAMLERPLATAKTSERNAGAATAAVAADDTAMTPASQVRRDEAHVTALRRPLRDARARAARYFEALSSREWRRGVWEAMCRDLDAELDASRAAAVKSERPGAARDAEVATLMDALAARDATIRELRAAAVEESAALRAALEQASLREQRQRVHLDAALSAAQSAAGRQTARIIEVESTFAAAAEALQVQLERAEQASAQVTEHQSRAQDFVRRLRHLERELEAARRSVAAANAAARAAIAELAAQRERAALADRPPTGDRR